MRACQSSNLPGETFQTLPFLKVRADSDRRPRGFLPLVRICAREAIHLPSWHAIVVHEPWTALTAVMHATPLRLSGLRFVQELLSAL